MHQKSQKMANLMNFTDYDIYFHFISHICHFHCFLQYETLFFFVVLNIRRLVGVDMNSI